MKNLISDKNHMDCNGETFSGPYGAGSYYTVQESSLNVAANRFFQYKAFLETTNADVTPKLYNVTVKGHTSSVIENVSINNAWVDVNGANTSMSGSGYSWSYANSTLLVGSYTYKVYANDSYGNVNVTEARSFTVPSYNITFNVTSGEDGISLSNVNITCSYSGFSLGGDTSNMYGPYTFPVGSWSCSFERDAHYDKVIIFDANNDMIIDIKLSQKRDMTNEEHNWLESLYNCVIGGDCTAYNMLQTINGTTEKIWQQYLPTDGSVVLQEDNLSSVLTSTNDISINYTLRIPFKEGYANGAPLPIMLSFWFTDSNGKCYNQDKQADSNRASSPYCIPLIAEYLGPNNGTVSFKVDLHPNLPDGTYNVVRSIDIDPPVNGKPVWINYGRELIGNIEVATNLLSSENGPEASSDITVEAKAPSLPRLNSITGNVVNDVKSQGASSFTLLISLAMVCLTILGVAHFKYNKKW